MKRMIKNVYWSEIIIRQIRVVLIARLAENGPLLLFNTPKTSLSLIYALATDIRLIVVGLVVNVLRRKAFIQQNVKPTDELLFKVKLVVCVELQKTKRL